MQAQVSGRRGDNGGVVRYPLNRLYEEVAFLAYYFHWDHQSLLEMDHIERRKWCDEASKINKTLSADKGEKNIFEV